MLNKTVSWFIIEHLAYFVKSKVNFQIYKTCYLLYSVTPKSINSQATIRNKQLATITITSNGNAILRKRGTTNNAYTIKHGHGKKGVINIGTIYFPENWIGKKVRIQINRHNNE